MIVAVPVISSLEEGLVIVIVSGPVLSTEKIAELAVEFPAPSVTVTVMFFCPDSNSEISIEEDS